MDSIVLDIQKLRKSFGGHTVVNDIDLQVERGALLGIIGPNGAGKSSFLNCITGAYKPDQGDVSFNGKSVVGKPIYKIIRMGVSRTFQVPKIFHINTLLENMLAPVLHLKKSNNELIGRAEELLEWIGLGKKLKDNLASELSGGQQKLLEFARSLMLDPDVVLLDEPFAGVHPNLKRVMSDGILDLHKRKKTILIVSHDMPSLYQLTNDIIVLAQGALIARGTPNELQNNSIVVDAYFGR